MDRTLGPGNHHPVIEQGYTFRVVSEDDNHNIVSSLSVNSSAGLNGTSITCEDGININGTRATIVAMVLGECYKNNFYITIIIAGVVSVECLTPSTKMSP